jgi:hypothetical protein
VFTAPLIIADVPHWKPEPPMEAATWPFSTLEFAAAAVAALLLALCITAVLWKRTGQRPTAEAQREQRGFVNLGPLELGPSTADQLRELEQRARTEGNA